MSSRPCTKCISRLIEDAIVVGAGMGRPTLAAAAVCLLKTWPLPTRPGLSKPSVETS
jgi:hypothetical protein